MSDDEAKIRLQEILEGPWAKEARIAWAYLEPTMTRRPRRDEIAEVLRPHWVRPIEKAREIEIRDSLDQALLELQLLELAVSTGYLAVEDAKTAVLERIDGLLWSDGAKAFVQNYNYYGVMLIAERVGAGFGLPGGLKAPSVDDGQAIRFASFLSVVRETYESDAIRAWQYRLDDYVYTPEHFADFERYLELGEKHAPKNAELCDVFRSRAFGMAQFIERYADFFDTVDRRLWPRYGLVPLYWLDKFFGYERHEKEYKYDEDYDWSAPELLLGAALLPPELPERVRGQARESLALKTDLLRQVLLDTHKSLFEPR